MRMRDERDPRPEHRQSVELDDLLVQDAMWAPPPADLLDSVLAAIDQRGTPTATPASSTRSHWRPGFPTPRTTPDG